MRSKSSSPRKTDGDTRRPLKLRPTQLRIKGACLQPYKDETGRVVYSRYELNLHKGEMVSDEVGKLIREAFLCHMITWGCLMGKSPWDPLMAELDARGYDLKSLEVTLDMVQPGLNKAPWIRKPRVPVQRAGVLDLRWGWVDYDHTPDMVCTWQMPCLRSDCSLLLSWLSLDRFENKSDIQVGKSYQLMKKLQGLGVDLRTFHLVIRKKRDEFLEKESAD